jgi:hypothetical protein
MSLILDHAPSRETVDAHRAVLRLNLRLIYVLAAALVACSRSTTEC